MKDCYIASGWFNPNQAEDLKKIKAALEDLEVSYFSPKDEIVATPDATAEEQEEIFAGNLLAINNA